MQSELRRRLRALEEANLLRADDPSALQEVRAAAERIGVDWLDAATNDYLGLASAPLPSSTASWGGRASRLVHGTDAAHVTAEADLARWLGTDAALLFSSGYAANVGAIAALAGPDDLIVSDELNHASIVDGCRLSKAQVVTYAHCDTAAAARALQAPCEGTRWLITESVFSMDGDQPDLSSLRTVANEAKAALYVDEAHAVGVHGASGRGLCGQWNVVPDVLVAAFGKAFGLQGACVAGSAALREWLYNRARSFVYSTSVSPALAEALAHRLRQVIDAEAARHRLQTVVARYHAGVDDVSEVTTRGGSPIVPIVLGSERRALAAALAFRDRGILVQPIRPPTVPSGTARLRLTLKANFDDEAVRRLVAATRAACAVS